MIFNSWHEAIEFQLPARSEGLRWTRLVDTNMARQEMAEFDPESRYTVTGRSVVVFFAPIAGESGEVLELLQQALPG